MGQYWYPVNLDKKEFIHPHKLGSGLKLWEQIANHPSTGSALVILCAAQREHRGGGDFDMEENWHGPERTDMAKDGPMPAEYPAIAKQVIGRWAGDRIALVGDYAEDSDLAEEFKASSIYGECREPGDNVGPGAYTDISAMVCQVIEHELGGKYTGDGWRTWEGQDA